MKRPIEEQMLKQCFHKVSRIFGLSLDFEQSRRHLEDCLELADNMETVEEAAKECKKIGKTNIPALKKYLRMHRKKDELDSFCIEADGQFSIRIENHAPTEVVESEETFPMPCATAVTLDATIPSVSIEKAFAPYFKTLYDYQNLLIDDLKKFGADPVSRLTIFNPPTSIGKTYMIPAIAFLAHQNGCKLVYSCSTRASIQEVHKAFASGTLRDYYMGADPETGTRKLLLIPSIKDAYINFFKPVIHKQKKTKLEVSMNEPEIAEYLPYCTLQDVNSMIELLIAHDKKPVSGRSSQIYGMNAYEKIKKILNDMESGIVFSQDYAEQMDRDFTSAASAIGAILHGIYRSILKQCEASGTCSEKKDYRILAKRRMLTQYPWVGKLYPGFLYDFADVVLLTNRKLTANIDPVGISRGSMIAPVVGADNRHWTLVDEVDQFCSDLLGDAIDRATRGCVDLKELICMIRFQSILALLEYHADDPESSKLIADPRMLPEGDAEQEQMRKELLALIDAIDTNDRKYDFIISQNRAMSYEPDVDADGSMLVPAMTVDRSYAHLIMPGYRAKKGKNQEDETVTQLILRTSVEDNRTRILKTEIPVGAELESSELLYEDWCRDTFKIVTMFLPIVRKLCLFYMSNFPGTTQDQAQRAVCERLTLRGAYGAYICANLLRPWSTSVSGNHFYAHGLTWNLMDTHNTLQTEINVETCNGFPDYLFANLCLNSQKTILCSATAGMKSLTMPDVQYVLKAIAGHDDDERKLEIEHQREESANGMDDHMVASQSVDDMSEFTPKDPNSLLYTMQNIPRASAMLQEKRDKEYDSTDFVFEYYDRTPKDPRVHPKADPACCGDVERYEEITGLTLSAQDQQNYSICNLAFACFTMDAMLKHQIPALIVYATPLPKTGETQDSSCYSMSRLEEAKNAILAKHGKTGMKFRIERMDAGSDKEITRESDEYVLVLSAYGSTGAGSNITVRTKLKDGLTPPEDLRGVSRDDITNIIPGPHKRDLWDARIRYSMTATYYFYKMGELESQRYEGDPITQKKCMSVILQHLYHGYHGSRSVLGRCLTPGQEGKFKKDAFPDDPFSPFKETQRKILLQAVNRVERGRNNTGGKMLICLSNTLIEKAGISESAYLGTAYPGCLFGYALSQISAAQNAKIQPSNRVELELLNRCYMEKNIRNREMINGLLDKIQKNKEAGVVDQALITLYDRVRNAYLTGGYGDNPDIRQLFYYTEGPGLTSRYAVQIPQSDNDRERIEGARLLPIGEVRYPCDIRCRPDDMGPYGVLKYHEAHGWLGKGWQDDFKEVLPYLDEICTYGYKYPPFANMHDVNVGHIYERMFRAVSRPGGAYHIGYPVVPYDIDLKEDFDLRYEGTHVVIDIKGYRTDQKPTTEKKFMAKIKRYEKKYGCRPVVLFINMVSGPGVNPALQKFRHFTYVNGFADLEKPDSENSASFLERRLALRALCDAHRM